jgi:hypothetical protein
MSLCQECTYEEIPNLANSEVKSYVLLVECATCQAAREAQNAIEAAKAPYINVDTPALLTAIKAAFTGRMLEMGGVFAVIDPYIQGRDWNGLVTQLADLVTEGVSQADVNTLKAAMAADPFFIDLDNIPAGV